MTKRIVTSNPTHEITRIPRKQLGVLHALRHCTRAVIDGNTLIITPHEPVGRPMGLMPTHHNMADVDKLAAMHMVRIANGRVKINNDIIFLADGQN